ncbi:MAG: DUF3048 domain-containing protein [Candidatus Saccharimonadales bacterium]
MDDITPPPGWPRPHVSAHKPMHSLRLRGQSHSEAQKRLARVKPETAAQPVPLAIPSSDTIGINEAELEAKAHKQKASRRWCFSFAWWRRLNRNLRFGIIALALLILGAGSFLIYTYEHSGGGASYSFTKHKPKVPATVASPLTGVRVAPALAARPVTGIMIENSGDARPQSGLQDAGVVYEAIAEGGVTRFLALFQDSSPQYIGPVRSLRPYYIDYAAPFQASIVHVGGSPDALSEVGNGSFRNLDQFFNGNYFTRVNSRYAPHNVYTSFSQLDALNKSKGYNSSSFTSWPRKADKKLAVPTAKTIDFAISGPDYYAHYDYNAANNSYLRSEGGAAHMDLVSASDTTGVQLDPKVVITIVVPLSNGALDASGAYYSEYADTGSGTVYVFQDGGVTVGTWNKAGIFDQLAFKDSSGNPIKLDAGQTWISLVASASEVSYKP